MADPQLPMIKDAERETFGWVCDEQDLSSASAKEEVIHLLSADQPSVLTYEQRSIALLTFPKSWT